MAVSIKGGSTGHMAEVSPSGALKVTGEIDPLPAGSNTIGSVNVAGSLPTGSNTIGAVTITGTLPAGDKFLGSVQVSTWQRSTFYVARGPASGTAPAAPVNPVPTANQDKILLVGWHDASITKTARIRKISVSALLGTAVTYLYSVYRVQGVPSGGTTVVSRPAWPDDVSSMQWMYQTTTATSTVLVNGSLIDKAVPSTTGGHEECVLYQWDPMGEAQPLTIPAYRLDGIAITSRCTTNTAPDAIITIEYTEEQW